jgi:hypothetical protein
MLREGHKVRVFETRILRRAFGSERDEITQGWMNFCSEEFHNFYYPNYYYYYYYYYCDEL